MPITFNCPCGKVLRIADESAGKRIKCPACQAIGTAPGGAAPAAPKFELVEDEPPTPSAKTKATLAPTRPAPAKPAKDDDDGGFEVVEDEDEKPKAKKPALKKGARRDDDDDEEEEKPKKKKKPRRDDDDERPRARRRSGDPDAGQKLFYIIGGLALVLLGIGIAAYWWNSGPHTGRRPYSGYIFGGCCVFVGIGTVVRGVTGNFHDD